MATRKSKTKLPSMVALVAGDRHLMKALMKEALQESLESEMSERRSGCQGGYYNRSLVTRIGKLWRWVPRDRGGESSTALFERYAAARKYMNDCSWKTYSTTASGG